VAGAGAGAGAGEENVAATERNDVAVCAETDFLNSRAKLNHLKPEVNLRNRSVQRNVDTKAHIYTVSGHYSNELFTCSLSRTACGLFFWCILCVPG
jgi:hypothetical protein